MFGDRLKKLRKEKDILQKDLADALKLSVSTIGMYEQGRRDPDTETLSAIAEYFNVSIDYLLGKTNDRNPYKDKPAIPEEFENPEEAVKFLLEQNVIMGFGGFDVNTMSDEEVLEFANELLNHLRLLSYKYRK